MPGIEFVSSFDKDPFVKSANAILSSVRNMAAQVEKMGGDMQHVMEGIFDGNNITKGMQSFFDVVIENFGLSERAAESFKQKATAAIESIAASGDDAAVKISKITTALSQIVSNEKQNDLGLSGSLESMSLEDLRVSASFLIDELNKAVETADELESSLSNNKGKGLEDIRRGVEDYEKSLQEASDAAREAAEGEETYIEGIKRRLKEINEQVNSTNDKTIISELNSEAEELAFKLKNAEAILSQIKSVNEGIDVKIADVQEVKETVNAFGDLNKRLEEYGNIIGAVEFGTEEATKAFENYANKSKSISEEIKGNLKGIAAMAGVAFGLHELEGFIQKVSETRSYFQDIESSMKVFLGSSEKAEDFTNKLKDYAWYNMFEFSDLAKASQQMIAYGQDVDTIIPKLDMLSNVASGTHAPLMEMVDAYNRAKSTGVVDAQGIKSWATKGVVIKDVLKEMGEAASGTQITFDQLNKVLEHITGEGGMFHNLMQEQLNNISAEKGQLEDNLANMYNEIGEKLQGAITKWYKLQSDMVDNYTDIAGGDGTIDFVVNVAESGMDFLMEHWKELVDMIKNAIVVYGSWRVAIAAVNAVHSAHVALLKAEAAAVNINNGTIVSNTIVKGQATAATVLLDKATKAFNASLLASPLTWWAAGLAAVVYGIYTWVTAESAAETGTRRANEEIERQSELIKERKENINGLIRTLADENQTEYAKISAYEELKKLAPELTDEYTRQQLASMGLDEVQKMLNKDMEDNKYELAKKNVEDYTQKVEELQARYDKYQKMSQNGVDVSMAPDYVSEDELEAAKVQLQKYREELSNIEDLRYKANTPIEVQIKEAEENANEKQKVLDFYDEAMRLAHAVEEADDQMAAGIENNGMTNYEVAVKQFDDFMSKVENDLKDPLTLKYGNDKEETERFLQELKDLKSEWRGVFSSPIPVWFTMRFTNAQSGAENARGEAAEGYHWVQTSLGWVQEKLEQVVEKRNYETISKERKQLDSQLKSLDLKNAEDKKIAAKLKKQIKDLDKELKGYNANDKSGEKAAHEAANRRRKLAELDRKEREERKRQAVETADSVAQARIAAEKDAGEKERLEIEYQYERDMESIKKLEDDYRKKTLDARKARWEATNTNKAQHYEDTEEYKSYVEDMTRIALTEDQMNDIKAKTVIAEEKKKDALRKSYQSELEAYKSYVSEYGSLAQQQYAISKQYEEKRKSAKNDWERRALDRQEERDLSAARLQEMTMGIDWKGLMSGVGTLAKDMMQPTLDALREYTKSDEYRNADAETQEKVASLIQELREYVGSDQEVTWQTLGKAMEDFQKAVDVYRRATEENKALKYDLEMAEKAVKRGKKDLEEGIISQEEYDKLVKNANDAKDAFDSQSEATADAKDAMDGFGKVLNNVSEEVENHVSKLQSVLNNAGAWKGVDGFSSIQGSVASIDQFKGALDKALPTMTEGLGKDIGAGLSSILGKSGTIAAGLEKVLSSGIGQMVGFIVQIPKLILQLADTIKNFVTGIVDSFSELLKFEWLEDLVNSILESVGNLINVIFDLPENIYHVLQSILVNGVGSLLNTVVGRVGNILTLGMIDSKDPFGWADNTAKMQKKIDELNNHSDALAKAMSSLEEAFEKAYGIDAMNRAEDMQKLQEQRMKDYQQAMIAEANKHGFMASSLHSSVNDNSGWKDAMKQVSNLLGISIKSSKDFLQLSAEQMQKIIDYDNGELWYKILQEYRNEGGKNGRSDQLASMLNSYVDEFGSAFEEIANDLSEKLTLTTEDSVLSDFQNALYDLADGSEDVMDDIASNWQQMVNRMVVSNLVMRDFQEDLEKWYKALADLQEKRNTGMGDEEYKKGLEALKNSYEALVGNAQKSIDDFREMGIIKSIQEVEEEAKTYFDDLASSWASMLTDMTSSAEDWKQQLLSQVFSDLVESTIFEAPLDVMIGGMQKHFDDFNAYLEDWKIRYKAIIEDTTLTDEERNARLKALIDEQSALRDEQAEKVKALGEGIGYEIKEEISNSLDNLGDTILSSLLGSEEDAEDMGRQIASTLIREMIETMLASEKYEAQFKAVKKKWQSVLSGQNVDEEGNILFTLDDVLSDIADINNSIANDSDLSTLIGQYKELNKTVEESDSVFKDLRSTFFDSLTNMEDDAESFRKRLEQTMVKDLIEKNVLDVPLTVNGQTFEDFTAYVDKWNERYADAVKDGNQEAVDALLSELVDVREMTVSAAEELRERLKESTEDTTFKGMTDSFINTLMDMNGSADDLAQDIGKTIVRRIIDQMVSTSMIQPLLDNLQSAVDNALSAEGATWRTAMNDSGVKEAIESITDSYPELQGVAMEISAALGVMEDVPEAFHDLRGTFVSTLLDMEADAETLGKNIAETMMEQMLETLVESKYARQMEDINKEWSDALEKGDSSAIDGIRTKILALYNTIGEDEEIKTLVNDIKALNEVAAETPLSGLRSSFLSELMDLESTTEDFANNINQILTEAFVDKFVLGDGFDEVLKRWEKEYEDIMGSDLSDSERASRLASLKASIGDARDQYTEQARAIQELMGITDTSALADQEATVNMADKATYDQFELYLGIAMAQQIALEQGNDVRTQILATLQTMGGITSPNGDTVKEIRSMLRTTNEHLYAIKTATEGIRAEFMPRLQSIDNKLSRL